MLDFSFGKFTVSSRSCSSESEMKEYAQRCKRGYVILGDDGQATEFFELTVRMQEGLDRFAVGICSEGHGLTPNVLLLPAHDTLLVGLNSEVVGIHVTASRITFRIGLHYLFHSFLEHLPWQQILIFHELGVLSIDMDGSTLWKFDAAEVLSDWSVDGDVLKLTLMNSTEIFLSRAGRPVDSGSDTGVQEEGATSGVCT